MQPMPITIIRVAKGDAGVFGVLLGPDGMPFAVTGERPDLGNASNISCIPAGTYFAERIDSPHFGYPVWRLLDVPGRSDIEMHRGNRPLVDSEGCILVAEEFGKLGDAGAVLDSKHGFDEFMEITSSAERLQVTIREVC